MHVLKSVGVLSCAKIAGAIYAALGLLLMPIILLIGLGAAAAEGSERLPAIVMLPLAILAPVIYGAMGFVIGALSSWIYNLVAKWVGGVQLQLQPVTSTAVTGTYSAGTV